MKKLTIEQAESILKALDPRLIDGIQATDYRLLNDIFGDVFAMKPAREVKDAPDQSAKAAVFERLLEQYAADTKTTIEDIKNGRTKQATQIRRCLLYVGVNSLQMSAEGLAPIFKMTRQGVSAAIKEATDAQQAGYDQHANMIEHCKELLGDIMGELRESMKNANSPK